jgi:FKBP-type peptidyl-prolyl cis-trans isomerase
MSARGIVLMLVVGGLASVAHAQKQPADSSDLNTPEARFSYAMGMDMGASFRHQGLQLDPDLLVKGLRDALQGRTTLLSDKEMRAVLDSARIDMEKKRAAARAELAAASLKAGTAYLVENKDKPGVVTTPSGLQYKVLKNGSGPKPNLDNVVVCRFHGFLVDGTEFDNSTKHDGSITFPVRGAIKGWTEALQMMPVGSRWQLVIPSYLGYGDRGNLSGVPPNATLIYDVELVKIKKEKAEDERERE